jgi:hypothetical protein
VRDSGIPADNSPAHVSTPQWQSFEIRMRARKAERCVQRAIAALESGSTGDAADALEEARDLDPSNAHLAEVAARLDLLKNPPPEPRAGFWTGAAVILWLVVLGVAGWQLWAHRTDWTSFATTPQSVDGSTTVPNVPAAEVAPPLAIAATGSSLRAVVETTLVRPEAVPVVDDSQIDDPVVDSPAVPARALPTSVATTGSARRADTPVNATAMEASPPMLDYPTPATLPPPAAPSATTTFIPAVPGPEPPRSVSAATNAAREPLEPVPSSSKSPSAVLPTLNTTVPIRDDRAAVRQALGKYEAAYNRLDVSAVRTIWPTLDQRALARAFDSLAAQRVSLQNCDVDVTAGTARANCTGRASWTPKIGGGEQTASRKWTFDLSELDGGWRITHVQAR